MKARSVLLLLATPALIAALSACTADGGSIYATIENEQKITVSTLDQMITVLDIVNTGTAPFPYLVAAGAVFKGALPDLDNVIGWPGVGSDPVPVPPPAAGALCTALTYFQAGVYGAFFSSDESTMGLYKAAAAPSYSFAVASGATAIADPLVAGKQISLLLADATNLYAVVARISSSSFVFDLVYSADGSTFTATNLTGLTKQITGAASFAGKWWVTAGPTLYSGAALNALTGSNAIGAFAIDSGDELRGVTVDSGYILIPTSRGDVYYSTDGTSWVKAGTSDSVNGRQVGFLTVSARVGVSGPGDVFLVGADGAGYYTLDVANGTVDRFSDVTVTGLYAGAVRKILVDPAQSNTVFMGTAGTGLWRATFDPATGQVNSTWIHE